MNDKDKSRTGLREPLVWLVFGIPAIAVVALVWMVFIAAGPGSTDSVDSTVKRTAQIQVADLMLAVQTLQLDPAYRQAVQVERWEANFAEARAGFEAECEALRAQIARLG